MLAHTHRILDDAEILGSDGLISALTKLRELGLDEFGQFFLSLPNPDYPTLSRILPEMASAEIQNTWTGASGETLLCQTLTFVRIITSKFHEITNAPFANKKVLDFGCGYGRIMRLMYYFTAPENVYGVDAWERSLELCRQSGILGHLLKSDAIPDRLPLEDKSIDLAFAYSIFTHLAPETSFFPSLSALRRVVKDNGLLFITVRPVEYWAMHPDDRDLFTTAHNNTGMAYRPHRGDEGKTYGDTSVKLDVLRNIPGWQFLSFDRPIIDPFQIIVCLRPN